MATDISVIIDELNNEIEHFRGGQIQLSDSETIRKSRIVGVIRGLEDLVGCTENGWWFHRAPLSTNDQLKYVDIQALNANATAYFSQSSLKREDLDWFYIDALIAYSNTAMVALGESLAGDQFSGAFVHGIRMLNQGRYGMGVAFIVGKLFKWLILIGAFVLPLSSADELQYSVLSLAAIGYVLVSTYTKNREYSCMKRKIFERIWDINQVYALTADTSGIEWDLLGQTLEETRRRGVPWLSGLYVAVQNRSNSSDSQ
jgi:hypothetical protein